MKKLALFAGLVAGLLSVLVDPALGQDCDGVLIRDRGTDICVATSATIERLDARLDSLVAALGAMEPGDGRSLDSLVTVLAAHLEAYRQHRVEYGRLRDRVAADAAMEAATLGQLAARLDSLVAALGSGPTPPADTIPELPPTDTIPEPPPTDTVPDAPAPQGDAVTLGACGASACDVTISWAVRDSSDTEYTVWIQGENGALVDRPAPNPATASIPRQSSDQTVTIMAQGFPSRTEFTVGSVTIPGTGGVAPAPPPPPPPPPPTGGQVFDGDFSTCTSDSDVHQMAGTTTPNNVHCEPGVGMRYDFRPTSVTGRSPCQNQTLASRPSLPVGVRDVWIRFRIRFSSNWTTKNPNCTQTAPTPDYKTVIAWLNSRTGISGGYRFNLKIGWSNALKYVATGPGYDAHDVVPYGDTGVLRPGASALWDGGWHTVELHFGLIGDNETVVQVRVDGQVLQNYRTRTTSGLLDKTLTSFNIGGNRNHAAHQLMHVWWDDFDIWTGSDPGFGFPAPVVF